MEIHSYKKNFLVETHENIAWWFNVKRKSVSYVGARDSMKIVYTVIFIVIRKHEGRPG